MYSNSDIAIIVICAVLIVGYCIYSIIKNGGIEL
jgi:hypothetical protein